MKTFSAIEAALTNTGRRSYAGAVLSCLLDAYDRGKTELEKRVVADNTGITETNVATVARYLAEQGVIDILYWDTKSDSPVLSTIRNGKWSIPYYRLTPAVLKLYRRK